MIRVPHKWDDSHLDLTVMNGRDLDALYRESKRMARKKRERRLGRRWWQSLWWGGMR